MRKRSLTLLLGSSQGLIDGLDVNSRLFPHFMTFATLFSIFNTEVNPVFGLFSLIHIHPRTASTCCIQLLPYHAGLIYASYKLSLPL